MSENSSTVFRERPLHEVKTEITRRAGGHLNPLDGIRAEDAEHVKNALTSLDRDEWAREWSKFGFVYEAQADALAKNGGDKNQCRELYELAFHNFRVGRYPCAGSPRQAQAYRDSVRVFRKAARYFDTPMEIIEVPFGDTGDKKLTGYLQIPKGIEKPPVIMHWGGVDGWKEDRQRAHARFHRAGIAGFAIDMPGTGESPVKFTDADATKTFSVLIDYLLTRKDIDATRLGVWGGSYGGYWAAKLAFVEAQRLKGAVFHGSNAHYGFQENWLRPALTEKASAAIFGPLGAFSSAQQSHGCYVAGRIFTRGAGVVAQATGAA